MTIERMIELLSIEHECILRNTNGSCDRQCERCELVQDDGELGEMYERAIAILERQESVKPKQKCGAGGWTWWFTCGACGTAIDPNDRYCRACGKAQDWSPRYVEQDADGRG
jgi:hypothetical protein